MTARLAPYFPQTYSGDAVTTDFNIPFAFLDPAHVRVIVGGVLKTLGTDYAILGGSTAEAMYTSHIPKNVNQSIVRFLPGKIPASSANNINLLRNTPISRASGKNIMQGPDTALYAHFRQQEQDDNIVKLDFFINATDLAAHTSQALVAPCDGYITGLETDVTEVVTTGGTVGASIESTAVTGMVVTVANSAAAGKHQEATPSAQQASYTVIKKGQAISITNASFATAGALKGKLRIQPADLT